MVIETVFVSPNITKKLLTARNVQFHDERRSLPLRVGDMTLHELCDACGVSRRAVQGYEKAGLVQPSGRNVRGYLIYDSAAQERICTIRRYQRLGFQIKEIIGMYRISFLGRAQLSCK